jgi:hypothetical protein
VQRSPCLNNQAGHQPALLLLLLLLLLLWMMGLIELHPLAKQPSWTVRSTRNPPTLVFLCLNMPMLMARKHGARYCRLRLM